MPDSLKSLHLKIKVDNFGLANPSGLCQLQKHES